MIRTLIAAAVLAASASAQAELYSCQEKGRRLIRDQPCNHKGTLPPSVTSLEYDYVTPAPKAPMLLEIRKANERKRLEEKVVADQENARDRRMELAVEQQQCQERGPGWKWVRTVCVRDWSFDPTPQRTDTKVRTPDEHSSR